MKSVMIVISVAGLFATSTAIASEDLASLPPEDLMYEQIHSDKGAGVVSDQRRLVIPADEWRLGGSPSKISEPNVAPVGVTSGRIERPSAPAPLVASPQNMSEHADQILRAKKIQQQGIEALERQRQESQLRAEIAEALEKCRDAGGCPESAPRPAVTVAPAPAMPLVDSTRMSVQSPADHEPVSVPSLEGVIGDKGLFVTEYGKLYAQRGSTLPGNFRVIQISLKEAVLDRDGTEYRVALKWDPRQEYGSSPLSINPMSGSSINNR